MRGALYIDGKDAYDEWGISVREGGYGQFICFPPMKEVESNDWSEYDGIESDLSSPVGDGRTFSMDFHCVGTYSDLESFLSYLRTPYVDSEGLSHGIYHTLMSREIGEKQVSARMVSLASTDLETLRSPMLFSISFADDSGFMYDESISIPSAPSIDSADFSIDGIPFRSFGITMLEGTVDRIKSGSGIKEGLLINVPDEAGIISDIGAYQKRRSRNIGLLCHMRAGSLSSMWSSWLSLENLLFKPGSRIVKARALGVSYKCHYVSCSVSRFFPTDMWIDFELTFKILDIQ